MCICNALKKFEMSDWWSSPTPSFFWCLIINTLCRAFVQKNINRGNKCFHLKLFRNLFGMHLTMFMIVVFFLSTTSFCWGVYLVVSWCWILCCSKKFLQARYSWPLSILSTLILHPLCFFANALNILKVSQDSDLCFKKKTQVFLLKSSMKAIKYLLSSCVGISTEQKFEWTISNNFSAFQEFSVGKDPLCFFLISHISRTPLGIFTIGKPDTNYFLDK